MFGRTVPPGLPHPALAREELFFASGGIKSRVRFTDLIYSSNAQIEFAYTVMNLPRVGAAVA